MGSYFVVVPDPFIEQLLRVRKVFEPARVEALVAKLAVEAFDETVLHGFARCDEVGEDAAVVGPCVEVVGGKLGAVVARDAQRRPVFFDEAIEDFGHVSGPKRALSHDDFSRQSVACYAATSLPPSCVTRTLELAFAEHGRPEALVCDNGPEFTCLYFLQWAARHRHDVQHIDPLATCVVRTARRHIAGLHSVTHYPTAETVTIGSRRVHPRQT